MPVLKVFLGALFTYQVIYISWLKLEEIEEKHVKSGMWQRFISMWTKS
jgi:hypothetical protein